MSAFGVWCTRWINLVFRANPLNPSSLFPVPALESRLRAGIRRFDGFVPKRLPEWMLNRHEAVVAKHTAGRFQHSNTIAAKLVGLDLRKWGYE